MCENQKEEIFKHSKIMEISTISSAIMMGIGLITVAFRMDTLICILCSIIASIFLTVTMVEMFIIEKRNNLLVE